MTNDESMPNDECQMKSEEPTKDPAKGGSPQFVIRHSVIRHSDMMLVVPTAFLAQFGQGATPKLVAAALGELGFATVSGDGSVGRGPARRRPAAMRRKRPGSCPFLSPVCPAVLNLIEMRFPSLIDHVAPFLTPAEAAHKELGGQRVAFVAACAAQCTALRASGQADGVLPAELLNAVAGRLQGRCESVRALESESVRGLESESVRALESEGVRVSESGDGKKRNAAGDSDAPTPPRSHAPTLPRSHPPTSQPSHAPTVLNVSGIRHVFRVLEMVENGLLDEARVIELTVCDEGCFGSPLWKADAFVARHRWEQAQASPEAAAPRSRVEVLARAVRRERRSGGPPGLRLDADMAKAIAKLAEIDRIARSLPGQNCSRCGAPTCVALAEDIVLGRPHAGCARKTDTEEMAR